MEWRWAPWLRRAITWEDMMAEAVAWGHSYDDIAYWRDDLSVTQGPPTPTLTTAPGRPHRIQRRRTRPWAAAVALLQRTLQPLPPWRRVPRATRPRHGMSLPG